MLLTLIFGANFNLHAQFTNCFSVSDNHDFDKVKYYLNATSCQFFVEASQDDGIMDFHGKVDVAAPRYEENIIERTKEVKIMLEADSETGLSSSLSKRLFSATPVDEYTWKMYLSKLKPIDLDLKYAVGDTYLDLSDLPIERLNVRTGSANVTIDYKNGLGNQLRMDTFSIEVDMGSLNAKNLHLSKSRNIIADVGFGNVTMDFGDAKEIHTDVRATVGAGKLEIILPDKHIPVKININDSPLCRIIMPKGIEKSTDSVFTSSNLIDDQNNYINFNVDVAVGSIVFKTSDR